MPIDTMFLTVLRPLPFCRRAMTTSTGDAATSVPSYWCRRDQRIIRAFTVLTKTRFSGKTPLADHVQKNRANIDFSGYRPLLDAILAAKAHYASLPN
jgi:hypothetical protein